MISRWFIDVDSLGDRCNWWSGKNSRKITISLNVFLAKNEKIYQCILPTSQNKTQSVKNKLLF